MEKGHLYRFGPFELDAARFELRRDGVAVEVQPKALDLILYLLRHRERVVLKSELFAALWPDASVTDASLSKAVRTARRALDDDSRAPRRIQTVRGRGFRFVDGVEERPREPEPAVASPAGAEGPRRAPETDAFVGREAILAAISGALALTRAGTGRLVLLEGDAGMGKTRTLQEAARLAREGGVRVAAGWCAEREQTPTLSPWAEVVQALIEDADASRIAELTGGLGEGVADLALLVGGKLASLSQPPARPLGAAGARARLVEGTASLVRRAARAEPLLVVLDDVHRADRASLDVLERLSHTLASSAITLIATFRPDELPRESPLRGLARRPEAIPLSLAGLELDEVARIVGQQIGAPASEAWVARIHAASGGNPLFAKELARGGDPGGALSGDAGPPLPSALRHLFDESLDRLSPATRRLLEHGAVAGPEIDIALLAGATEAEPSAVVAGLDEGVAAGCLVRRGRGWAFKHELVRRALVEELPSAARAAAHRRIGEVLEARGFDPSGATGVRVAQHLCAGALSGGSEHAVAVALEAGEGAIRRLAHEEAAAVLGSALEALALARSPDPAMELRLLAPLGEALVVIGEREAGREKLRRAVALARDQGAGAALVRAALAFGGLELSPEVVGDPELLRFLEDVSAKTPRDLSAFRVRAVVRLGLARSMLGLPIGEDLLAEVKEAARDAPDPVARAHALYGRRWTLSRTGDLGARLADSGEMLALARQAGSPELELAGHSCRFLDLLELGRLGEADHELEAHAELADLVRVPRYRYRTLLYRTTRALLDGRFADAERLAQQALGEGNRIGAPDALGGFFTAIYTIFREQARWEEILGAARSFPGPLPSLPIVFALRSMALLETGCRDELESGLPEAVATTIASRGPDFLRTPALTAFAEVVADLGATELAGKLLPALLPLAGRVVVLGAGTAAWGALDGRIGRLEALLGDRDAGLARLDAAARLERAMGARPWLAWTELARARVLEQRDGPGDAGAAARARAAARAEADALGLRWLASRLSPPA